MDKKTPLAVIESLVAARNREDIESALACYEVNAAIVAQSGAVVGGEAALRSFIEASAGLRLTFSDRRIIEGEEVALHFSRWSGTVSTEKIISGHSADVLRRQSDGRWLIAIDNPWGSEIASQ